MERLAERAGRQRAVAGLELPALRPHVVDRLIEAAARRNAKAALLIFIPGADMPVLTAVQMRLVLQIAACYGQELSPDRAVELLRRAGRRLRLPRGRRAMLDFVPVAGWAVQSGDRLLGHQGAGPGGDRVLRARRGGGRLALRALAEGLRSEVEAREAPLDT